MVLKKYYFIYCKGKFFKFCQFIINILTWKVVLPAVCRKGALCPTTSLAGMPPNGPSMARKPTISFFHLSSLAWRHISVLLSWL